MGFTIKDYDLRNTFATERKLLLLSGFYPRRDRWSFSYIFSAFVNLLVSFGQLASMLVQMAIDRNDLSKFSETFLFFMTHMTFLCKLTNFLYYKHKLLEIEDKLARPIFYGFPHERLESLKIKMDSCKLVGNIFRVLCFMGIVFYMLIPIMESSQELSLPLPGWIPYDAQKYYYPTAGFQMLSISVSAYNNSSIDILTCVLMTVASAEYNLLKENLKLMNFKPDGQTTKETIAMQFTRCIKHHKEIVGFVSTVEDVFSKGIFLQFFTSIVVFCFTGFQMIVVPVHDFKFFFLIVYFSCMLCQIAMYCWYGHDVITTSNTIGNFFYMSNWYESDLALRTSFLIFLENTKKPTKLTAGKLVTLSLATFTTILRSSYSYFAVLQHMYTNP